jgi:hypothetical protein
VNNRGECTCQAGWDGPRCTHSRQDHCSGNGTPEFDGAGHFRGCSCDQGYLGNECQFSDAVTCHGHGTVNNRGECTCQAGWDEPDCRVSIGL